MWLLLLLLLLLRHIDFMPPIGLIIGRSMDSISDRFRSIRNTRIWATELFPRVTSSRGKLYTGYRMGRFGVYTRTWIVPSRDILIISITPNIYKEFNRDKIFYGGTQMTCANIGNALLVHRIICIY